ncbi:TIGR00282 family metallophosphoesterase [Carboxydochorda subterranea]|uniref:TIGR00282 family metallophosphoesterase n=1 Tax=Carboxydichorda subterranea TaxID=3109565 RepID=A0ABZ1C305_9FIRM|nr:TIGR00282 family metallophosphoesterase [Limnochorda sp. L945t]WRP18577.1 TIGR00282 family metallophosphoesterase [Limnochorda sp. L945t]
MRILLIGDVVGRPGRRAIRELLPPLIEELRADFVVVNGENAAGGFGITEPTYRELLDAGAHVVTTGNHVWDRKEVLAFIDHAPQLVRPANFPPGAPGRGSVVVRSPGGVPVAVLNLMGRTFMSALDCPFRTADRLVEELRRETPVVVVDFHAEATAEKVAMGWFLDGRATVVFGTHTHVPTADERVLPRGTAYLTDLGMTGPRDGVIGMEREGVLRHLLSGLPHRFEVASGVARMDAALVQLDEASGRASSIQRIHRFTAA